MRVCFSFLFTCCKKEREKDFYMLSFYRIIDVKAVIEFRIKSCLFNDFPSLQKLINLVLMVLIGYTERTILLKYRSENNYVMPLNNLYWTLKLIARSSKLFVSISSCLNLSHNYFYGPI
jgi:hypothetical protein